MRTIKDFTRRNALQLKLWRGVINPLLLVWLAWMPVMDIVAQNPIICDRYTPDPAPYVHGDTLYLFVDHDEDVTLNGYFTMKDWLLYSTVDMVNWTYRGTPLTSATSTPIFISAAMAGRALAASIPVSALPMIIIFRNLFFFIVFSSFRKI